MKKIPYRGWQNNILLENDLAELVITLDVGPRIIRFAKKDGANVFKEYDGMLGKSGESEWMIRGGHRFWTAPEAAHSYAPDNVPVPHETPDEFTVKILSPANEQFGWQKEMTVSLSRDRAEATVHHKLRALTDFDSPISIWALSVMAPGGEAIIPQPPRGEHPRDLLPDRKLILWPYTDINDPRYSWSEGMLTVKQDTEKGPTKIGLLHKLGWAGYRLGDTTFKKTIAHESGVHYPDGGVNFELFTNQDMLELESIAPLQKLTAGECSEHTEIWTLE